MGPTGALVIIVIGILLNAPWAIWLGGILFGAQVVANLVRMVTKM